MKKICLAMLICCVFTCLAPIHAYAFGGDVDYDSGGGDYGGGGSDYGSTDSWTDTGGSGSSRGGPGSYIGPLLLIAFFFAQRQKRRSAQSQSGDAPRPNRNRPVKIPEIKVDEESIERLRAYDRDFNLPETQMMVTQWVQDFETAWSRLDMTPYQDRIMPPLFEQYQKQLDDLTDQKQVPRTEGLTVSQCIVESWSLKDSTEYLTVWIDEKKRTYLVSAYDSSIIVKGNLRTEYRLIYRWQLTRTDPDRDWKLNKVEKLAQVNL